jgi:hypothetical protein
MGDLITKLVPILHVGDPDAERRFYGQLGLRTGGFDTRLDDEREHRAAQNALAATLDRCHHAAKAARRGSERAEEPDDPAKTAVRTQLSEVHPVT